MPLRYKINITTNKALYFCNHTKTTNGPQLGFNSAFGNFVTNNELIADAHDLWVKNHRTNDLKTLSIDAYIDENGIAHQCSFPTAEIISYKSDVMYQYLRYKMPSAMTIAGGDDPIKPKAQSNGGNDFWGTTAGLINSYTSPKADFVGGAVENKIGQILLDRGKYGSLHPETIIRTPVANISLSTKLLQNTGTALKWGGRAFGAVGLVGTYAQWQTGAIGNTEAALDATFGAIGFIPGYGWAVSGAYFLIAKPLYNYSTKP